MMENERSLEPQWISQAQQGNASAFGHLVTAYQKPVYGFILGMVRDYAVAEDLTQQTFIKAWKGISGFRGESALQTWLFQVALNTVRSWGRWKAVWQLREISFQAIGFSSEEEGSRPAEDLFPDTKVDASPERGAESRELGEKLRSAIAKLPEREKAVFLLRHDHHMPLKEIGATLGIAEGSVKAHLSHALDKLRKYLGDGR